MLQALKHEILPKQCQYKNAKPIHSLNSEANASELQDEIVNFAYINIRDYCIAKAIIYIYIPVFIFINTLCSSNILPYTTLD